VTSLIVQATSVTAFLGAGAGTTDPADDMGVRLSGGAMDLRLQKNTATGDSAYAFAARGTAALVGLNGLSASGTLVARRSTMPTDTVLTFGSSDTTDDVTVAPGDTRFGGSINVTIASFTTVAGNFGFEKSVSGSTTKIKQWELRSRGHASALCFIKPPPVIPMPLMPPETRLWLVSPD